MTITIGDLDVQRFFKYSVSRKPVVDSANSFMTADGTKHTCVLAYKYTLQASGRMIDTTSAASIISAVAADTFSVTFVNANGEELTRTFRCDNVPFDLTNRFSDSLRYWSFDLTFEEV